MLHIPKFQGHISFRWFLCFRPLWPDKDIFDSGLWWLHPLKTTQCKPNYLFILTMSSNFHFSMIPKNVVYFSCFHLIWTSTFFCKCLYGNTNHTNVFLLLLMERILMICFNSLKSLKLYFFQECNIKCTLADWIFITKSLGSQGIGPNANFFIIRKFYKLRTKLSLNTFISNAKFCEVFHHESIW